MNEQIESLELQLAACQRNRDSLRAQLPVIFEGPPPNWALDTPTMWACAVRICGGLGWEICNASFAAAATDAVRSYPFDSITGGYYDLPGWREWVSLQAPGHTDLMVAPETLDAFVEANPPPVNAGDDVTPSLLEWMAEHVGTIPTGDACSCRHCAPYRDAAVLVRQRDAYGRAKYDQGLKTGDGRDTIEDARQELGDLMQYVWKARMQGLDLGPIRRLMTVLEEMLEVTP